MKTQVKLALTGSFLLGFLCLGLIFRQLNGPQTEVEIGLAMGCGVSIFVLWLASSAKR